MEHMEKLEERVSHHLSLLSENMHFNEIALYLSYFYETASTIYDYFKTDICVSIFDPERIINISREFSLEQEEIYKSLFEEGHILTSQSNIYFSSEDLLSCLSKIASLYYRKLPGKTEVFSVDKEISFSVKTMHPFYGKINLLIDEIKSWINENQKIILLSGTKERGIRIKEVLDENGLDSVHLEYSLINSPRVESL